MTPAKARRRTSSVLPGFGLAGFGLALLVALSASILVSAPEIVDGQESADRKGTDSSFAGMVEIPAGKFEMGVDEKWFTDTFMKPKKLIPPVLNGPQKDVWWAIFRLETPEHKVTTEAYAIDRFEVTNLQYLKFLDDACQVVVFTDASKKSIELIATEIYGDNVASWQIESLYWLNEASLKGIASKVLEANPVKVKRAIDTFNRDLPEKAHKKEFSELPEPNRVKAWQEFDLPENTAIKGYSRTVPRHWERAQPIVSDTAAEDQRSQPVRWVSGNDAAAFAAWAGKHIPTESQWEKAARGPKNTVYPWGDTWDAAAQRDILIWSQAKAWKGAPGKDRPAVTTACPEGQSGYGCFNMLGNVMEWTSSIPERYPRSDAKWRDFGGQDLRVCRGGAYGGGVAFKSKEISIRATARILEGPDGAVNIANRYSALGFRCAKYPTPARDVLAHTLEFAVRGGFVPKDLEIKAEAGFGVERPAYAASDEKSGMTFVTGRSLAMGVIPVERLNGANVKQILDASEKETVVLGYVYWDSSLKVAILKPIVPEKEEPPVVIPEDGPEDGTEGEGDEGTDGEKPPEDKPAEGDDDGDGDGEAEGEGEAGEEAAPVAPTEERVLVNGVETGFILGIQNRRLALFEAKLSGVELFGFIPVGEGDADFLRKVKAKDFKRTARMTGNQAVFDIPMLTRSSGSRDIFAVTLKVTVEGAPQDGWLATEE